MKNLFKMLSSVLVASVCFMLASCDIPFLNKEESTIEPEPIITPEPEEEKATIVFHSNLGDTAVSQILGTKIVLSSLLPEKEGYHILGVYTSSTCKTEVDAEASILVKNGLSYYIKYEKDDTYCNLTIYNNTDNIPVVAEEVVENKTLDLKTYILSVEGYQIMGVYKDENYTEEVEFFNMKFNGDISFYVKYEQIINFTLHTIKDGEEETSSESLLESTKKEISTLMPPIEHYSVKMFADKDYTIEIKEDFIVKDYHDVYVVYEQDEFLLKYEFKFEYDAPESASTLEYYIKKDTICTLNVSEMPIFETYHIDNFYLDENYITPIDTFTVTEDKIIYVYYLKDDCKLTVENVYEYKISETEDSSNDFIKPYNFEIDITDYSEEIPNYTFIGLFQDKEHTVQYSENFMLTQDCKAYAYYKLNRVSFSGFCNNGTIDINSTLYLKNDNSSTSDENDTNYILDKKELSQTQISSNLLYSSRVSLTAKANIGYHFEKWINADTNETLSENSDYFINSYIIPLNVQAIFLPNENTKYTIEYYVQNENSEYPTVPTYIDEKTGTTNDTVSNYDATVVPDINLNEYNKILISNKEECVIKGDGTTVIRVNLERKYFKVSFNCVDYAEKVSIKKAVTETERIQIDFGTEYKIEKNAIASYLIEILAGYHLAKLTDNYGNRYSKNIDLKITKSYNFTIYLEPDDDTKFIVKALYKTADSNDQKILERTYYGTTDTQTNVSASMFEDVCPSNKYSVKSINNININGDGTSIASIEFERLTAQLNFITSGKFQILYDNREEISETPLDFERISLTHQYGRQDYYSSSTAYYNYKAVKFGNYEVGTASYVSKTFASEAQLLSSLNTNAILLNIPSKYITGDNVEEKVLGYIYADIVTNHKLTKTNKYIILYNIFFDGFMTTADYIQFGNFSLDSSSDVTDTSKPSRKVSNGYTYCYYNNGISYYKNNIYYAQIYFVGEENEEVIYLTEDSDYIEYANVYAEANNLDFRYEYRESYSDLIPIGTFEYYGDYSNMNITYYRP